MAGELTKRVAVAAIGIPVAIALIYFGGWILAVALAGIAALGALELYRIAARGAALPFNAAGAMAAAVIVLLAAMGPATATAGSIWFFAVALLLLFSGGAIWLRGVEGKPLGSAALTCFGALFVGGTLAFAVWLRGEFTPPSAGLLQGSWPGAAVLAFPLAVTWISDSAAYFGGRAFGRHKLIPKVSPGKTIEGALFGLAGGLLVGAFYGHGVLGDRLGFGGGLPLWILGGGIIAIFAQVGDLAESLLKREAGVKDSGTLLPGHGGVLDRFDALFFTLPAAYAFLHVVRYLSGAMP